jgi:hypothetical protein
MINTDADRNEIMNTGIKFVGYGKALFPPHPEDLQPEIDCCTNEPCVEKKPCQADIINLNIMNVGPKTGGFRFSETNNKASEGASNLASMNSTLISDNQVTPESTAMNSEVTEEQRGSMINNNLKFAETSNGGVLFIPPPMMYDIPYMNQAVRGSKPSSFLQTDSSIHASKNKHGNRHHSKITNKNKKASSGISTTSGITSEATEGATAAANPVNLNVLSAPSKIVESEKNATVFEYNPNTGRRGR